MLLNRRTIGCLMLVTAMEWGTAGFAQERSSSLARAQRLRAVADWVKASGNRAIMGGGQPLSQTLAKTLEVKDQQVMRMAYHAGPQDYVFDVQLGDEGRFLFLYKRSADKSRTLIWKVSTDGMLKLSVLLTRSAHGQTASRIVLPAKDFEEVLSFFEEKLRLDQQKSRQHRVVEHGPF